MEWWWWWWALWWEEEEEGRRESLLLFLLPSGLSPPARLGDRAQPPGVPNPNPEKAAPDWRLLPVSFFSAPAPAPPSTESGAIVVGVEKEASAPPPAPSPPPSSLAPGASGCRASFSLRTSLVPLLLEWGSSPAPAPLRGVTQPPIPPPITCSTRSLATAAPSGLAGEGGGSSSPGTLLRCLLLRGKKRKEGMSKKRAWVERVFLQRKAKKNR